ncbi:MULTISPECIES: peptidoglycan DD-metalloendopeptidase family protein [unclassified Marinobacter]|uniref:peptidoglycan DD-metalloendopeptidase family protein n=1 Tax=unclassified Marinobacter TaxID=83889 RepID=UPI0026E1CD67|nr:MULTISPECIES: peptidoglycan DD-metalloendopeptidase family protein [unclassified Marinobacter]MDO6444108.1 peptidoglycan DD-metalloendopeptidase family protein [Marinobacter sp. 2_MG-2023]MDO6823981.1 peptidoglycan DD-metalloendopeptidase family protein [Marinobacter sp. 1_MG-2023]
MLKTFPKTHITIAATATVVVTAAILMSPSADVEAKRMSYALDLEQGSASEIISQKQQQEPEASPNKSVVVVADQLDATPQAEKLVAPDSKPHLNWQTFDIKSGDTLSSLFKMAGFNDGIMLSVIHGEGEADKLQRLYAGETIRFATDSEGELAAIELQRSLLESLKIERQENSYEGLTEIREPESKPAFASGTIDGSLYLAARDAGLNDRLTMELAGIFGWDIDFVYDVRKGDQFEVVYEELYLDGEKFNTGRILSARFINRGEENIALLYTDSNGDSDYYTPDGKSMRKAFLRTPISARVSSPFNLQRRHPVLDVVRPHEGTDYAAPPGTPIKAAGNGRVQFSGWKGGYGRTVVLKHGDNITTLYAHMSRIGKGMKNGARVKQGETIGYVGSSGMVTGPHLHYEFRLNGSPRNSRTVKLPDAQPIPASEMARFKMATDRQVAQFETFRTNYQQLALASDD